MRKIFNTKNKRLFFITITLLLADPVVSGQMRYSFLDTLTRKFERYCQTYPREEIYMHTDREEYIAGENVWFNIYLFDRKTSAMTSSSSIAYVEILNPVNHPVVQKKIKLGKGLGPGQVILPDTLSSGRYIIRAYTNWMKNWMPGNCFMKYIYVYNPLNTKGTSPSALSDTKRNFSANQGAAGKLTAPGLSFDVKHKNKGSLEVIIKTDNAFRSANNNMCFLFINTGSIVNYRDIIILADDTVTMTLNNSLLSPGINHFTLFSSGGKPMEERYIYNPQEKTWNPLLTSPDSSGLRSRMEISITGNTRPETSSAYPSYSVSVAPAEDYNGLSISDYMIFGSEFGILPEIIQTNGLKDTPLEMIEQFLSVAGSNWIKWDAILDSKFGPPEFNFEKDYQYLSGHLLNRSTMAPDSGQILFLSEPGKNAIFRYSLTDRDGYFNFVMDINDQTKDIIIQPEKSERNNLIKLETPFCEKYPEYFHAIDTVKNPLPAYISRWSVNSQVNRIYGISNTGAIADSSANSIETKRFYGIPDIELVMDNFIELSSMEDVFYELVDGVFIKKKRSGYEITVADPVYNKIYELPPVLFIDGVVVSDPAVIASLDPSVVEKIDVIRERYIVGDYLFYGLVNVITKAGDYSRITLPDYAIRLSYNVAEPSQRFVAPDYSNQNVRQSRIPDFRNTLYWNPSLSSTENDVFRAELWTSDYAGDYEINIQGVNSEGKPVSIKKTTILK